MRLSYKHFKFKLNFISRATVAMVTDDPEHKKNLKKSLSGVFTNGIWITLYLVTQKHNK